MFELQIKIPASMAGGYKVIIGTDILGSLWQTIERDYPKLNKFVVTDENLSSSGWLAKLTGEVNIPAFIIAPAGEISKNINTVISIIESMEKAYLGRDTLVVALGGGTVGDIAGFAASIFKRGVPVLHIPTTTIAQADSAIGGKTGVDSSLSKNAFGTFWHPVGVYIDVSALATLDERQFRAGLVESVKHTIIADGEYFNWFESNLNSILEQNPVVLEQLAMRNCKIKGRVVEADPYEKNQRRMLNYGHTIGHAVEAASGFKLLHGEAVAIGIIGACLIELELKLAKNDKLERIRGLLKKIGVPVTLPGNLDDKIVMELIKHDKKAVNKWPRFALTTEIGQVYSPGGQYAVEVNPELVGKILKRLR
jgi:3-dehydroquinate synthase